MPEVETVGLGEELPTNGASGNNVYSLDGKRDLFNVADFYKVDENYLSILDIHVSAGQTFSPKTAATNDLLMSEKRSCAIAIKQWLDRRNSWETNYDKRTWRHKYLWLFFSRFYHQIDG